MASPDAVNEPDIEEKAPPSVVEYAAAGGQTVILSKAALEAYGTRYIDELARSSGKEKLLLADKDVLEDAKVKFPDSKSPLIDMYSDYMPDMNDYLAATKANGLDITPEDDIASVFNEVNEDQLEEYINSNSPGAYSQPNGTAGTIIIPEAASLKDDAFKNRMIEGLSFLDPKKFGDLPGKSMDWAKFAISHECAHLKNKDSDRQFNNMVKNQDIVRHGNLTKPELINKARNTFDGEIKADISAAHDFNIVSGNIPPVPQAVADLRIIGGFISGVDTLDYGGSVVNDHNTGRALSDDINGKNNQSSLDRLQYDTAYTNTLVRGFIGATDGKEALSKKPVININNYQGNPISSAMGKTITKSGYDDAMKGNDPMRVVSMGSTLGNISPEKVYASTKVLYEKGAFDSAPESKRNAELYLAAVERSAPGMVNNDLVEKYRGAWDKQVNQNFMQELHRYYQPDAALGHFYQPGAQMPPPALQVAAAP